MRAEIKIKKLNPNAKIPTRGSDYAAAYDGYACIDQPITIAPHCTEKIGLGIAVSFSNDYWLGLFARSGLATKQGLRPANCIGVIDSDYRGELIMAVHNDFNEIQYINPGDRIGQLMLLPKLEWDIQEVNELDETDRGSGGFGSTGK